MLMVTSRTARQITMFACQPFGVQSWPLESPASMPAGPLTTMNGESRTVEVFYPKGHPKNRMSSAEVEGKFRGCARAVLSEAQQTKIISLVHDLEKLSSVAELMAELAVSEA